MIAIIYIYIEMEYYDKILVELINEFDSQINLKSNETLSTIGYYIASRIFIEILEGINYLHIQNPPLIHRDLKLTNILLKKCDLKGYCVVFSIHQNLIFIIFFSNEFKVKARYS
jgi:serine/threonine protein kinase